MCKLGKADASARQSAIETLGDQVQPVQILQKRGSIQHVRNVACSKSSSTTSAPAHCMAHALAGQVQRRSCSSSCDMRTMVLEAVVCKSD